MAETAVQCLVEMVADIVIHYATLIADAEVELLGLQNDLEGVKACLKEAGEMPDKGPVFKLIEKRMREAIYDVEDALDTCLSQAEAEAEAAATASAAKPKKRNFLNRRKKEAAALITTISMTNTVQDLRALLKPIYDEAKTELHNLKTTQAGSGSSAKESQALVKKDMTIRRDKVVALVDVEETIIGYLMEPPTKALDVIPIIGMPGLGKTTLTCKIYDSDTVQRAFHIRIWVNVSQTFNKKAVLVNILKTFKGGDMSSKSDFELAQDVRACLSKGKFLIVLDDVWNVDHWKAIETFLPVTNGEGKVIITSRFLQVGRSAGSRGPYELRRFKEEESWKLLQLEVFQDVDVCPEELIKVGKDVAENCDGLPLTVVVIGGLLLAKYSSEQLIGVIKSQWTKVAHNVIHFIRTDEKNKIQNVVALSYDILSDELKECFLYMGVFPEDHVIPAWILTRLWIAEGFILQKENQSLEETAENYLNDLINRNLLMVGRINQMGENKTCSVHDVIHAFCISEAAKQNLFHEIKRSDQGLFPPSIPTTEKYHRFCFNSDLSEFLSQRKDYQSVRSFLSFYKEVMPLKAEYNTSIPKVFKSLRILNADKIKFDPFPPTIDKLSHLRYITLYVHDLSVIPEAISKLWNLQTLLVDTNSTTVEMKANLWKMLRLRHVKTNAAMSLDQEKKGEGGKNIQTLSTLSPESCTETVADKARNMKELRVRGNLSSLFDANNKFLQNLRKLEKLKLVHEKSEIHLPRTNCFPPQLKRLTLRKTSLDWSSDMSTLANIKTLEVLKLKQKAFNGVTWKVSDEFPNLQFLLIKDANIVSWEASAKYFPSLSCLSIKNCEQLKEIPLELAKNLRKLVIDSLQESAVLSAKKIEEQKKKDEGHEQKVKWGGRFQLSVGHVLNY